MSEAEELAELVTQLERTPAEFRSRLARVLREALESPADGKLEVHGDVAGKPGPGRNIRQWRAWYVPSERPR